jgi:hypothetical protein
MVKAALLRLRRLAASVRRALYRWRLSALMSQRMDSEGLGPTVLIWELGNIPGIVGRNGLLAIALRLHGVRTRMILCDGTPIACIQRGVEQPERLEDWKDRCAGCSKTAFEVASKYCLEPSWLGEYVDAGVRLKFDELSNALSVSEIQEHEYLGVKVGQMAWSSLNRHMKGLLVDSESLSQEQETILRRYLFAALVNSQAADVATRELAPRSVLTSHGVYVDYAPAMSIACKKGINAVSWSSAYADGFHYFTIPQEANRLMLQGVKNRELWKRRADEPLTASEDQRLDAFLRHRYFRAGARDINVLAQPQDKELLRTRLGLNSGRPLFCLFTHVNWDACFDMSSMIFPNANVWTLETIRRMIEQPDIDWIVRIHPGELTDGSVLSTGDIIRDAFPSLPSHIKILWADSDINSFGLYKLIDGGITIFGTVGVELAAMGKPVILAGRAHYGEQGFTHDAGSEAEYFSMLRDVADLRPLDEMQTALARRYAYWYFVQRQIPIRAITSKQGHWGDLDLDRIDSLLPGRDPVMDLVCENIVEGRDFVLPSDSVPSVHG